jgi:hypothetical protein
LISPSNQNPEEVVFRQQILFLERLAGRQLLLLLLFVELLHDLVFGAAIRGPVHVGDHGEQAEHKEDNVANARRGSGREIGCHRAARGSGE